MPFPFINYITTAIQQAIMKRMVCHAPDGLSSRQNLLIKSSSAPNDTATREEADPWTPDNSYYAG